MKLEVGMYVRTIGGIERLKKENDNGWFFEKSMIIKPDNIEKYIIKASYNIIDILEVGDYVNGSKVIDISIIGKDKEKWVWVEQTEDSDNKYGDDYVGYNNDQIKSIVTHEQIEQMTYVIEKGDDK